MSMILYSRICIIAHYAILRMFLPASLAPFDPSYLHSMVHACIKTQKVCGVRLLPDWEYYVVGTFASCCPDTASLPSHNGSAVAA